MSVQYSFYNDFLKAFPNFNTTLVSVQYVIRGMQKATTGQYFNTTLVSVQSIENKGVIETKYLFQYNACVGSIL